MIVVVAAAVVVVETNFDDKIVSDKFYNMGIAIFQFSIFDYYVLHWPLWLPLDLHDDGYDGDCSDDDLFHSYPMKVELFVTITMMNWLLLCLIWDDVVAAAEQ